MGACVSVCTCASGELEIGSVSEEVHWPGGLCARCSSAAWAQTGSPEEGEKEDVEEALKLGASGYFPKTLSGKALLKAIERVAAGEKFIPMDEDKKHPMPAYYDDGAESSQQSYVGMKETQTTLTPANDYNLTPRENDVLEFLVTGASNKEIANALGLQVVTVKLHVRGICRKLDAKNRTQAALIAREQKLVKPKSS